MSLTIVVLRAGLGAVWRNGQAYPWMIYDGWNNSRWMTAWGLVARSEGGGGVSVSIHHISSTGMPARFSELPRDQLAEHIHAGPGHGFCGVSFATSLGTKMTKDMSSLRL